MAINLYREYRIKNYLNARHYIVINGKQGEVHPHTWEFSLRIRFSGDEFIEFTTFERAIAEYLSKYQNQVLNEVDPFDGIIPTVENMTDYFSHEFYEVIRDVGGSLVEIEASETPTRSYILTLSGAEDESVGEEKVLSRAIDNVLDDILK